MCTSAKYVVWRPSYCNASEKVLKAKNYDGWTMDTECLSSVRRRTSTHACIHIYSIYRDGNATNNSHECKKKTKSGPGRYGMEHSVTNHFKTVFSNHRSSLSVFRGTTTMGIMDAPISITQIYDPARPGTNANTHLPVHHFGGR